MKNRKKRTFFTLVSGIMLLSVFSISRLYAQSAPADFNGTWNTVTSKGKKIVVSLQVVRRAEVSGTYGVNALTGSYPSLDRMDNAFLKVSLTTADPGIQTVSSIRGRIVENVLRFRWQEDSGHGAGKFTLSSDGQSFTGTFSLTDLPDDTSGGTWNGTRAPNFYGVWRTTQFPELLLQQTGGHVDGRLFVNRPEVGIIKEGVVDGDTLRFKIYRPRLNVLPIGRSLPDDYVGTGELVMNADGKSFKGTILGVATTGTLVGR